MTQRQYRTLSKRIVDSLPADGKDTVYWDRELPGFGLRVYTTGRKVFVVQTRAFGRSKWVTLGEHGNPLSADRARKEAAEVIVRIKTGQPPVPPEPASDPTVADLADRYFREYVEMHCKPATVSHYRIMLHKYIVPALGERLVAEVEHKDILRFHNELHHSPPSPTGRPTFWSRCTIWRTRGAGVPRGATRPGASPASGSRSTSAS